MKKIGLKIIAFLIFISPLILNSCASNGIEIPGKHSAEIRKLDNEYIAIADEYLKMEKYDKAIEYYKLGLKSKENYWSVYYKLAKTYVYKADWEQALPMYETLLQRDNENNSLKVSIAYIYAMSGNVDKAIEIYEVLIKENPENEEYLQNVTIIFLQKKDLEASQKYFEKLKISFPDNTNLTKIEEEINKLDKELNPESELTEEKTENEITDL